jgi:NAD(P)H-hydrate epimerase
MKTLTRAQVRELDRRAIEEFGVPGVVLMENAGRGAAEIIWAEGGRRRRPVVICCGKGNNGGDGFVIARHLDRFGASVRVLLFAKPEELAGDAAVMYGIVERSGIPILVAPASPSDAWLDAHIAFQKPGFKVDALFGTGLQGPPNPPFDRVIRAINRRDYGTVMAVDIPSGLDCDTGEPMGAAVSANYTVTFVARKRGFSSRGAKKFIGKVRVVDIGAPRKLLESVWTGLIDSPAFE